MYGFTNSTFHNSSIFFLQIVFSIQEWSDYAVNSSVDWVDLKSERHQVVWTGSCRLYWTGVFGLFVFYTMTRKHFSVGHFFKTPHTVIITAVCMWVKLWIIFHCFESSLWVIPCQLSFSPKFACLLLYSGSWPTFLLQSLFYKPHKVHFQRYQCGFKSKCLNSSHF